MSEKPTIQASFLEQIRLKMPPNLAFAEELAELLAISRDSAYRRIRGETLLSIEEVTLLSNKFGISLDALLAPSSETVTFHVRKVHPTGFTFEKYLQSILGNLEMINGFQDKELIYSAKDIPIFHYFPFPELAAFKMFFWMKTVLRYPQYEDTKFSSQRIPDMLKITGDKIWSLYATIPSTEIWSDESVNVTVKQIEFYRACGFFESEDQYKQVVDEFLDMLNQIEKQAEKGRKMAGAGNVDKAYSNGAASETASMPGAPFSFYKNEILIADNSIFFKMGDKRVTFLTHNTFNILTTSDPVFCMNTEEHLNTIINKSTLISTTAEKERIKFFNRMEREVQRLREDYE